MRKVFLETLPQKQNGNIDWKSSPGYIVDFIYDDYVGNFKILSYDSKSRFVELWCENKIYYIKNDSLRYGYVAQLTGKITYDFLYNNGIVNGYIQGPISIEREDFEKIIEEGQTQNMFEIC